MGRTFALLSLAESVFEGLRVQADYPSRQLTFCCSGKEMREVEFLGCGQSLQWRVLFLVPAALPVIVIREGQHLGVDRQAGVGKERFGASTNLVAG